MKTVYDLIRDSLSAEAVRTEPDGRDMIRSILRQLPPKPVPEPPEEPEPEKSPDV